MISIKDAENFVIGHSANNISYSLHGKMFTHDNRIEITGIQAYSNLVIFFPFISVLFFSFNQSINIAFHC